MADNFNDKHLLWWVLKAVHACRAEGTRPDTLLSETMWKNIGAPEWVLPAVREKYGAMPEIYRAHLDRQPASAEKIAPYEGGNASGWTGSDATNPWR